MAWMEQLSQSLLCCCGICREGPVLLLVKEKQIKSKNYNQENEKWKTRIPEHLRLTLRLR